MLRTQLEGAAVEDLVPPSPDMAAGKDKLISMLEALAERVEARAQSSEAGSRVVFPFV